MIAHVAEAGEQRGRVVLKLGCCQPNKVALDAAIRVAQAFRSEIESLFIEEPAVFDAARLSFTREVSLSGRHSRDFTVESTAREMRHLAEQLIRQVDMLARIAEVPSRASIVRNEPLKAMAEACRACGPWNVIALADCRMPRSGAEIQELFDEVADTTGLVFVGPKARTSSGPVVIAVEDAERIEELVRTASRLVLPDTEPAIQVLLFADDETRLGELDGQVRLGGSAGRRHPEPPHRARRPHARRVRHRPEHQQEQSARSRIAAGPPSGLFQRARHVDEPRCMKPLTALSMTLAELVAMKPPLALISLISD